MWIKVLYCYLQHHNDTINKQTQEDFFNKICISHLIARVRKGYSRFAVWEGVGDRRETAIFWPPPLMAVNVVSFSFSRCSTGGPEAHSAWWWLSLLHFISNFSGPQTPSEFPRPLRPDVGLPTTSRLSPSPTLTRTHQGPQGPFGLVWLSLPHLVLLPLQLYWN